MNHYLEFGFEAASNDVFELVFEVLVDHVFDFFGVGELLEFLRVFFENLLDVAGVDLGFDWRQILFNIEGAVIEAAFAHKG